MPLVNACCQSPVHRLSASKKHFAHGPSRDTHPAAGRGLIKSNPAPFFGTLLNGPETSQLGELKGPGRILTRNAGIRKILMLGNWPLSRATTDVDFNELQPSCPRRETCLR
jgi:hypothetical protein